MVRRIETDKDGKIFNPIVKGWFGMVLFLLSVSIFSVLKTTIEKVFDNMFLFSKNENKIFKIVPLFLETCFRF